jgi:hypothetical protein
MCSYEIRLSSSDCATPVLIRVRRASDYAAIRNAHSIAKNGDSIEVWRGEECIYTNMQRTIPSMH